MSTQSQRRFVIKEETIDATGECAFFVEYVASGDRVRIDIEDLADPFYLNSLGEIDWKRTLPTREAKKRGRFCFIGAAALLSLRCTASLSAVVIGWSLMGWRPICASASHPMAS